MLSHFTNLHSRFFSVMHVIANNQKQHLWSWCSSCYQNHCGVKLDLLAKIRRCHSGNSVWPYRRMSYWLWFSAIICWEICSKNRQNVSTYRFYEFIWKSFKLTRVWRGYSSSPRAILQQPKCCILLLSSHRLISQPSFTVVVVACCWWIRRSSGHFQTMMNTATTTVEVCRRSNPPPKSSLGSK